MIDWPTMKCQPMIAATRQKARTTSGQGGEQPVPVIASNGRGQGFHGAIAITRKTRWTLRRFAVGAAVDLVDELLAFESSESPQPIAKSRLRLPKSTQPTAKSRLRLPRCTADREVAVAESKMPIARKKVAARIASGRLGCNETAERTHIGRLLTLLALEKSVRFQKKFVSLNSARSASHGLPWPHHRERRQRRKQRSASRIV